jgi:hypothetical protein
VAVSAILAACSGSSAHPPARAGDLYQVDGETAYLQCQDAGSPNAARSHGSATLRFGGERLLLCPYAGGGSYQIRPAGDGSDR